jgi:hypothetical protein
VIGVVRRKATFTSRPNPIIGRLDASASTAQRENCEPVQGAAAAKRVRAEVAA